MDHRRRAGDARRLAQERRLLGVALDQVDFGAGRVRERAGDHQAGEAGAAAEVDPGPGVRREVEKLERVGDVPGPELGDGGMAR